MLNMLSLHVAHLAVHFDVTLQSSCCAALSICLPLCQQYLLSLARLYGIWLGCALCKLAGFNNSVATFVARFVTALI